MGRPKGWVMSPEHKAKLAEGRKKAREEKLAQGIPLRQTKKPRKSKFEDINGLPVMYITGKEKDAFDFLTSLRTTFRSRHDYKTYVPIEREICHRDVWKNVGIVQTILSKHVYLKNIKEKG